MWLALGLTQFLSLVRGFWVPRFLGPADYGVLGTIILLQTYSAYLHLGVLFALSRELPMELAKGNIAAARALERTAVSLNLLLMIPVISLCLLGGMFHSDPATALAFLVLTFLIPLSRLELNCDHQLKSHLHMSVISSASGIGAVISFLLVIPAVAIWGLPGVLLAMILAAVYPVAHKTLGGGLARPGWNKDAMKRLFRIGLPLFFLNFSGFLFLVADRTAILSFLGKEYLGYYMIGVVIAGFLTLIPINLAFAFSPRIMAKLAKTGDAGSLATYLMQPLRGSAVLSGWLSGFVVLILPFCISQILPAYLPGLPAAMVVSVAAVMIGVVSLPNEVLVALGKMKLMTVIKLVTLMLVGLGDWFVLSQGWGLVAVALVNLIIYTVYTCILGVWSARAVGMTDGVAWWNALLVASLVLTPGIIAAGLTIGLAELMGIDWGGLLILGISLLIWLLLTLPWWFWLLRDGLRMMRNKEE